ncbi:MAG: hypothetical protein V3S51_09140 [Dehalococcoidia bacterium]
MITETVADWYAGSNFLGYVVVFGILAFPVYLAILTAVVGKPRNMKVTGIFLAMVCVIAVGFIVMSPVLGAVLGLFVP